MALALAGATSYTSYIVAWSGPSPSGRTQVTLRRASGSLRVVQETRQREGHGNRHGQGRLSLQPRRSGCVRHQAQKLFWIWLNDAPRMSTRNLAPRLQLKRAGGDIAYRYLN
jgi:hypothetical protein